MSPAALRLLSIVLVVAVASTYAADRLSRGRLDVLKVFLVVAVAASVVAVAVYLWQGRRPRKPANDHATAESARIPGRNEFGKLRSPIAGWVFTLATVAVSAILAESLGLSLLLWLAN